MRVVSYNVNSVGARLPRLLALLAERQPDAVCLQETKAAPESFPHGELEDAGYIAADHSGGRWEGVAVLARRSLGVTDVSVGLPGEPNPTEARWIEATVGEVRVVSAYVPNGRAVGSDTFVDKLTFFDRMADRMSSFADSPAIVAGDMNVCPTDHDVWDAAATAGGTHVTAEERHRFSRLLEQGFVDAFRRLEPDEPGFTWWDYRAGHFHKGYGLRIDLLLASLPLTERLAGARVDRDYRKPTKVRESKPSDHAPLIVDFD